MQIFLTEKAIAAALGALAQYDPKPDGIRVKVMGGGCAGFRYMMDTEDEKSLTPADKTFVFGSLKVFVDAMSLQYLDGVEIDYVESDMGSGFKFKNPQVKSTCGCGQSFET